MKACVWALDSFEEFEESWGDMLHEFDLANNEWLQHIYNIRELWVHVYFKEDFLGSILRTTSGSKSQNCMFGSLTCPILNLMEFWVRFLHAVDSQWHRERKAQNASLTSLPELKTTYEIEKHARNMYTHMNFYVF